MKLFRLLTEDDSSEFCRKVSETVSKEWMLHGDPIYALNAIIEVMRCGKAVVEEAAGDYLEDLKHGVQ